MSIPDDFDPKPTAPTGGLDRMIQIWEASRDVNSGGYGGSVLQSVSGWGTPSAAQTTSCSPFTATCIGMMYDPGGATDGNTVYAPMYDSGATALPVDYYILHNGFYFQVDPDIHNEATVHARKAKFAKHGWKLCDDSALATVFFNLGYAIDLRDIRRGDLIGIDWASGHGHAAFVWDVHLDSDGAVDCFQFLSANGYKGNDGHYHGAGVSVSCRDSSPFIDHVGNTFAKKPGTTLFEDKDDYVTNGWWYCMPAIGSQAAITQADVKLETFRVAPPQHNIVDASFGGNAVSLLRAVRFWGFAPPDAPHGELLTDEVRERATSLKQWETAVPYGSGSAD
jgi:hypothetical protein